MILLPQPLKCCALTDVSHRSWYLVLFNFLAICLFSQWDVCSYFLFFIYLLTFANFCYLFWRIGTSCVIQAGLELSMCPRLEFTVLCVRFKNAMSFLLSWAQPSALLFSSQDHCDSWLSVIRACSLGNWTPCRFIWLPFLREIFPTFLSPQLLLYNTYIIHCITYQFAFCYCFFQFSALWEAWSKLTALSPGPS